jgi:hypothetical protein
MMDAETVSETLDHNSHVTQLTASLDITASNNHEINNEIVKKELFVCDRTLVHHIYTFTTPHQTVEYNIIY